MKYKAILFDLGDIFFEAHYWRKWMWEYFVSVNLYEKDFASFYQLYETYIEEVYTSKVSYEDMYEKFVNDLNIVNADFFIELSYSIKKFFENNRSLYDGVKDTLEKLQGLGIATIVITDNESTEAVVRESVIGKFGINCFIDKVITSFETKVTKPNPVIFQKALDYGSFAKEDVLFVGHDVDEINGAVDFGVDVVEFNNYLKKKNNAIFEIASFEMLLSLVKKR